MTERGEWLPAVPVVGVYPGRGESLFDAGPVEPDLVWRDRRRPDLADRVGVGLASPGGDRVVGRQIRLGPGAARRVALAGGELDAAVMALRDGRCSGLWAGDASMPTGSNRRPNGTRCSRWWVTAVERIERRASAMT